MLSLTLNSPTLLKARSVSKSLLLFFALYTKELNFQYLIDPIAGSKFLLQARTRYQLASRLPFVICFRLWRYYSGDSVFRI